MKHSFVLTQDRRNEILSKVSSVPSLPGSATQAIQLLQDPDVDMEELARVIEYDPGLTANLLRLVNSPYFGTPRSASSVKEALVRLGTNDFFQLVVASAVAPMLRLAVKGYELPPDDLWEHSVAVAIGSGELAAVLGLTPPDHTFTAGLLHDIGKILLGTFVEVDALPIMEIALEGGVPFEVAEQQVLGIDHAEVGAFLLESWNLPPCIVEAVQWHHMPECFPGDSPVVDLIHIADALSMIEGIGTGSDGLHYRLSGQAAKRLNLKPQIMEAVGCKVLARLDELGDLFTASIQR